MGLLGLYIHFHCEYAKMIYEYGVLFIITNYIDNLGLSIILIINFRVSNRLGAFAGI